METYHLCPRCGSLDIQLPDLILSSSGAPALEAKCPVCGWSGPQEDTLGVLTSESLWDSDRVLSFLHMSSLRNVGHVIQSLELIGLIPKMLTEPTSEVPADRLAAYNTEVEQCRTAVLRASLQNFIVTLISASEVAHKEFSKRTGCPLPKMFEEQKETAH